MKGYTVGLLILLLAGCTDSKAVNAAFAQSTVSWYVLDNDSADGLRPLIGFEQALKVEWVPRNQGVFVTDLAPAPGASGAAAVAGLGLLVFDDRDGQLRTVRPAAQWPLSSYRTGSLFTWNDKLFVPLAQELSEERPASLAWWAAGQTRLAFYPVPSQVRDPSRQVVSVQPPAGSDVLGLVWKQKTPEGWSYVPGTLDLATGAEGVALPEPEPVQKNDDFRAVRLRLFERTGKDVETHELRNEGTLALYTETGWVAVAREGENRVRLYHLPDLGLAGRYSHALLLDRGFLFSWEMSYRGYAGAAGLVHVPFAVLSP